MTNLHYVELWNITLPLLNISDFSQYLLYTLYPLSQLAIVGTLIVQYLGENSSLDAIIFLITWAGSWLE